MCLSRLYVYIVVENDRFVLHYYQMWCYWWWLLFLFSSMSHFYQTARVHLDTVMFCAVLYFSGRVLIHSRHMQSDCFCLTVCNFELKDLFTTVLSFTKLTHPVTDQDFDCFMCSLKWWSAVNCCYCNYMKFQFFKVELHMCCKISEYCLLFILLGRLPKVDLII